jgi:pSer/pThr/pTyr-binding forkhead associated (FHA) protein
MSATPDPGLPPTVLAGELNTPTTPPVSAAAISSPPVAVEASVLETPTPTVATQLQRAAYHLLHLQTNSVLEIPPHLSVVHIGKPNDKVPPDLDVSGFPCSEVVSRIHANLRLDGDSYYIEDIGSANGTYINHNSLPKGNRHLLRAGDRISLGKGDLVTFIFQST